MKSAAQIDRPAPPVGWALFLVIGLALLVLAATLIWSALDLRGRIRAEIVQHDAETLEAVTIMQHANDQANGETIASLADAGEQFSLALKVSSLRNVLGIRLYSAKGEFVNACPGYIRKSAGPGGFGVLAQPAPGQPLCGQPPGARAGFAGGNRQRPDSSPVRGSAVEGG